MKNGKNGKLKNQKQKISKFKSLEKYKKNGINGNVEFLKQKISKS